MCLTFFQITPNPSLIERNGCKRASTSLGHGNHHSCEALRMGSLHRADDEIWLYHTFMLGVQSHDQSSPHSWCLPNSSGRWSVCSSFRRQGLFQTGPTSHAYLQVPLDNIFKNSPLSIPQGVCSSMNDCLLAFHQLHHCSKGYGSLIKWLIMYVFI